MEKEKWYTLTQAGLSIGKSKYYFGYLLNEHPEYFDDVILQEISNAKVIRKSDIPKVLQHTKKGEDRRRSPVLTTVKAKNSFAFFFPIFHYSKRWKKGIYFFLTNYFDYQSNGETR